MTTQAIVSSSRVLANGTEVIWIQGADAEKSAIAVSFRCGHFYDDKDCPGLAHLLEHMLFMGSQNFPDANTVLQSIELLGGQLNAHTGTEFMTLHSRFSASEITQVVHLLSAMLSAPLFRIPDIEQEIATIDAEYQYKRKDDLRRLYQVHKETCNPDHPFSQFSVGNADIFRQFSSTELQQRLHRLHQRQFRPSQCKIAVISAASPFTALEQLNIGPPENVDVSSLVLNLPTLYRPAQKQVLIAVQSLSEAHRLIITYTLGELSANDIEALGLISHLLGDEGPGSLLALLKFHDWVISLSAGGGIEGANFKDFNISLQLTSQGAEHIDDIVHSVVHYLELLRQTDTLEWRIQEKRQLSLLMAATQSVTADTELCSLLAEGLFRFSSATLMQLQFSSADYSVTHVVSLLDQFSLNNLRIKLISHTVAGDQIARWYKTPYRVTPLLPQQLEQWSKTDNPIIDLSSLRLPDPNPFIATTTERRKKSGLPTLPEEVFSAQNCELWAATDPNDDGAKADAYISLESPANAQGVEMLAAKRLWLGCLNDRLQQRYYAAEVAGLSYRLYGHQGGLSVHTTGFAFKQKNLILTLFEELYEHHDFHASFARIKSQQQQSLRNNLLNKPINRLFTRLGVLMQRHSHAPNDVLSAMQNLSLEQVESAWQALLKQCYLQGFMHGGWRVEDIHTVGETLARYSASDDNISILSRDVAKLTPAKTYYQELDDCHDDAAALLFLQAPSDSIHDTALTMLLEQLLATPFFDSLRTQKQLGYLVGSGFVTHNSHPGMVFYVQSPTHDANTLVNEITHFLIQQINNIDYYQRYFPQIRSNLIRQLLSPDLSSSARAQRLWVALGTGTPNFNRNAAIANSIQQLSFDQLVTHAKALQQRELFGEMVLYSTGKWSIEAQFAKRSNTVAINDIEAFKAQINY
ncbi:insulinase family protein [Alteromonas flava]|uniref:insulinase family protein n=1 Tax=Alteromonas flava TaxID=2048003 RepID=UPI0013DA0A7C|nr:insulinase family protein [Alteromonas flava]